jgi:hypothetical protein
MSREFVRMPGRIIRFLLLFILLFDPQTPYLPNGVGISIIVFAILFIPYIYRLLLGAESTYTSQAFPLFFIFICCLVIIVLRIIFNQGDNAIYLLSWVKAFALFAGIVFFVTLFFKKGESEELIKMILFAFILNGVINIIVAASPGKFEFLQIFRSIEISDRTGDNSYRNSYIAGSGFFSIGTAYGLAALLTTYYITRYRKEMIWLVPLVFIAISGFVAARTSFFAVASCAILLACHSRVKLVAAALVSFVFLNLLLMLPELSSYKDWMLGFFVDRGADASAAHLLDKMYYWPGSQEFLLGTGYVNSGKYEYTDSGYMQDLLFGGVLFMLLKISIPVIFFVKFYKSAPVFVSLIVMVIFLFHLKGQFLYNNAQGMSIFYFIYFSLLLRDNHGRPFAAAAVNKRFIY